MRNSKYFHPRPFVGNNIEYRIGSSAAQVRFKESQTYILNQLAFNPFHKFSVTAKEILLFKYDIWFDFINELEQYLLVTHNGNIDADNIIGFSDIRAQYYKDTLIKQPEVQNNYFMVWDHEHDVLYQYFINKIKEICNADMPRASIFGAIIDVLIKVMAHTLYELQELDIIFFTRDTPIFNLDELSCNSNQVNCLLYDRILNLKKVRNFDSIIIKNYLNDAVPFKLTNLYKHLKEDNIKYIVV
ncbi:MAG: hypothetical protein KAI79_06680 [Bacteroidales bacterium]|nr:hypothetical protein [Bacteroidales bacterium]